MQTLVRLRLIPPAMLLTSCATTSDSGNTPSVATATQSTKTRRFKARRGGWRWLNSITLLKRASLYVAER
jgi:phosphoserine aminotransferase